MRLAPRFPRASLLGLLCLSALAGCTSRKPTPFEPGPASEPRLFADGIVSTEDDEQNGSFSPDGTEYYFAKLNLTTTFPRLGVLCVTRFVGGHFTEPEVLPFSGSFLDLTPRFSPDGRTLYFTSSRPAGKDNTRLLRIWSVERTGKGWGTPTPLPPPINAPDTAWNLSASVTADGTLYFASSRDDPTHLHIYRSARHGGTYEEPQKLGPAVNSDLSEADPYISADEKILVFTSQGEGPPGNKDRAETLKGGGVLYARGDLYVSENQAGAWSPARHLEHWINTQADESAPSLTPDGRYLFFSSERSPFLIPMDPARNAAELDQTLHSTLNGHGNVFYVSTDALELAHPRGAR